MPNTELGFTVTQLIPTEIEKTNPVRVTVESHGLTPGQTVRATRFYPLPVADDTGMYELNNNLYVVSNCSADTFDLFDVYGNPIDGRNYTTFNDIGVGQFNLTGPALYTQNLNTMDG